MHDSILVERQRGWRPLLVLLVTVALAVAMVLAGPGEEGTGLATAATHTSSTGEHPALAALATAAGGTGEQTAVSTGRVRTYFIASEEVVWDYAPNGRNLITGAPFDDTANVFVAQGTGRIGSRYVKCLYRGYIDGSFTRLAERSPSEEHLGLLGPVIRAEVGDTINVQFLNRCSIPTGVHPHGVLYAKDSEGALYADGTSGRAKGDDAVPTGGRHLYNWLVPERAGPGPMEGSSVMWMYHGHTDEVADTNAGLMGPMVVTRAGSAQADGRPKDVDREVFNLFTVLDENQSPYLAENIRRFAGKPIPGDLTEDEGFIESNLKHSINGYLYGNGPQLSLRKGERVRWYLMGMGTEVDLHTPHWHGNTVVANGMRADVVPLLPATMIIADMAPDNLGTWLYHCHVNDHITAGMQTRYTVVK